MKTYRLKIHFERIETIMGRFDEQQKKHGKEVKRELVLTSIPEILSLILRFFKKLVLILI